MNDYKEKYLKYKNKYLCLKKMIGGNPYEVAQSYLSDELTAIITIDNYIVNGETTHIETISDRKNLIDFIKIFYKKNKKQIREKILQLYTAILQYAKKLVEEKMLSSDELTKLYRDGEFDNTIFERYKQQFSDIPAIIHKDARYETEETRDINNLIRLSDDYLLERNKHINYQIYRQIEHIITYNQYNKELIIHIIKTRISNLEKIIHVDTNIRQIFNDMRGRTFAFKLEPDSGNPYREIYIDFYNYRNSILKMIEHFNNIVSYAATDNTYSIRQEFNTIITNYGPYNVRISKDLYETNLQQMQEKYIYPLHD